MVSSEITGFNVELCKKKMTILTLDPSFLVDHQSQSKNIVNAYNVSVIHGQNNFYGIAMQVDDQQNFISKNS